MLTCRYSEQPESTCYPDPGGNSLVVQLHSRFIANSKKEEICKNIIQQLKMKKTQVIGA